MSGELVTLFKISVILFSAIRDMSERTCIPLEGQIKLQFATSVHLAYKICLLFPSPVKTTKHSPIILSAQQLKEFFKFIEHLQASLLIVCII